MVRMIFFQEVRKMVETKTNCNQCVHQRVCSIMNEMKEIKNKIFKEYEHSGSHVSITVNCKEYQTNYTTRGCDFK